MVWSPSSCNHALGNFVPPPYGMVSLQLLPGLPLSPPVSLQLLPGPRMLSPLPWGGGTKYPKACEQLKGTIPWRGWGGDEVS